MYLLYDKISIVLYRITTLFKNKLIRYYLIPDTTLSSRKKPT